MANCIHSAVAPNMNRCIVCGMIWTGERWEAAPTEAGAGVVRRKGKASGHVCQRIDGRKYGIYWTLPNGKPASRITDAAGAVRFCERHNVTILPPTGAQP